MKNILIIYFYSILFISCTGLRINKDQFKPINVNFSGSIINKPIQSNSRNKEITLDKIFGINESNIDKIKINFIDSSHIRIEYIDSSSIYTEKNQFLILKGKFSKKGYFEFYRNNKKIKIPPLFPIIYSNTDIDRIRIASTINDNLIIDYKYDHGINIFLLAGGTSERSLSHFKIENEK